jgi:hypothetical protein
LYQDAVALRLSLAEASLTEDRRGWWVFESEEYVLRRMNDTGYFVYINKKSKWNHYEKEKEPVSEDDLRSRAIALLTSLGLREEQFESVQVKRIVDQAEDAKGELIGPRTTAAFMVYVRREINELPVFNSDAKVVFTPDGVLHKISISWRKIDVQARAAVELRNFDDLEQKREDLLVLLGNGREADVNEAKLGYMEEYFRGKQTEFVPRYVIMYSFQSMLNYTYVDAVEEE